MQMISAQLVKIANAMLAKITQDHTIARHLEWTKAACT